MKLITNYLQFVNEANIGDLINRSLNGGDFNRMDQMYDSNNITNYLGYFRLPLFGEFLKVFKFNVNGYDIYMHHINKIRNYDDLETVDIKVHCECNDFKYRFQWMAFNGLYDIDEYGLHEIDPSPDERNPRKEGSVCKHLLQVFTDIKQFEDQINSDIELHKKKNNFNLHSRMNNLNF